MHACSKGGGGLCDAATIESNPRTIWSRDSRCSASWSACRSDLSRTRRWTAHEERREAERRVGESAAPAGPESLIERGLDRNNIVAVHTGECWDPGERSKPATRAQAIEALRQQVPACTKCRPDTALGFEDQALRSVPRCVVM
ncbi:DUF6233 domain-containing protein [Streptomyces massasporeus]|uniref:DUF6233 domain-containing protein n=1 Tax=Streptomyces massasporeus TaxID=67324 RepID=UPI00368A8ABD